jgi:DNA-binding winged helix-turn-helix (wHTH) protein/TolB-like protein/Flp pilus assembly protein TadD
MSKQTKHFYEFGEFRLEPDERQLLRAGEVVPLKPKAFDLLLVLVSDSGHLVSKEELLNKVWHDSNVEEANISHNIYKLREALGDGRNGEKYIENIPRRGYRFVAQVTEVRDEGVELLVQEHARAHVVIEEEAREPAPTAVATPNTVAATPAQRTTPLALPAQVAAPHRRRRTFLIALGVVICAGLVGGYIVRARRGAQTRDSIRSLAVLPFRPLSTEGRDEALELGMADALITKLSNVRQLVVRPTSAVLKYGDASQDLLAAGREQNVDAVIDGKVQRVGDRIRATVQLVRVSDGASLWADTFDDQFTNVFAVQDSISERAARALVSHLTGDETQRLAKHYTDNIQAYQLYLEGRFYWAKFSPDGVAKSIDYFNQAIALDQNYALAYTGLADAYSVQGAFGIVSPEETLPKGKRAVETALRLDDSLAQAHQAAGGLALLYERDWTKAKQELERAIELNPNLSDPHELLGYYWEVMGQLDQAQAEMEKAQQVAPLMMVVNMDVGNLAYFRHHYDEAIELHQRAHALDPDFVPLPFFLAQAYERKGEYDQAIASCQRALASTPDDPALLSLLGYAYARAGKTREAQGVRARLEEMQRRHYVSPFMLALFYTGVGDKDKAFEQLNKAYEVHDPQLIWFRIEPELDDLHADPRFAELMRRMKLSP